MLSKSQKKLLQKYGLLSEIEKILKTLGQNLPQKNQEITKKLDLLFTKNTLQKTFETRTLSNKNKQNLEFSQLNANYSNSVSISKKNQETEKELTQKLTQNQGRNASSNHLNYPNQTPKKNSKANLFDDEFWKEIILPQIEHPHFAKPQVWKSLNVPNVLIQGNHSKIQKWREFDWKSEL